MSVDVSVFFFFHVRCEQLELEFGVQTPFVELSGKPLSVPRSGRRESLCIASCDSQDMSRRPILSHFPECSIDLIPEI